MRQEDHRARRIWLIEPDFNGHRLSHCAMLVRWCVDNGVDVTLATTDESLRSAQFDMFLRPLASSFETHGLGALPNQSQSGYLEWVIEQLDAIRRVARGDHIVLLEGDKLLPRLALSPKARVRNLSILVIRTPTTLGNSLDTAAKVLAKSLFGAVCLLRGVDVAVLAPAGAATLRYRLGPWRACPDPIGLNATAASAREFAHAHGLDAARSWIGVYGNVVRRKNLDLALRAAAIGGARARGFLVAGVLGEAERARCAVAMQEFEQAGGEIVIVNRLLSDRELDSAIMASDLAIFAHSGNGPSQILGKAVAAGTPFVAAGSRALRTMSRRLGGGEWVRLAVPQIARAIGRQLGAPRGELVVVAGPSEFARALLEPVVAPTVPRDRLGG